jgi:hypothetical protein
MTEKAGPIPRAFCDAFNGAISAYLTWSPGELEPVLSMNQQPFEIGAVCTLMAKFEDPMPEELWHVLLSAPGSAGEVVDRSYGSAARYLAQLISDRRRRSSEESSHT